MQMKAQLSNVKENKKKRLKDLQRIITDAFARVALYKNTSKREGNETWCRFITVKKEGNQEMFLLDRPYQLLLLNFFSCITILKLYNNAAARLKLK